MKIRVSTEKEFILNSIVEAITARHKARKEADYGDTIRFGVTELARIYMREVARRETNEHYYYHDQYGLLNEALSRTEQAIQEALVPHRIQFDISELAGLEDELVYPAKELAELGEKLSQAKRVDRIGSKRRLSPTGSIPFEIIEIGLTGFIEGLLIRPLVNTVELNLEEIGAPYTVEGEWFPFQVQVEDFTFVIDDDGTIFISTQNFPPGLFERVREMLWELARRVYTQ